MNLDIFGLATFIVTIIVVVTFFYVIGRANGIGVERMRAESLCHQAILKRNSGSVKWVWNAVSSGRKELVPHAEFFVDDQDARKSQ